MDVLILVGTRPEAVKMAPVAIALRKRPEIRVKVCSTGQHREILAQTLADFDVSLDANLDIMTEVQTLSGLTASVFEKFGNYLKAEMPDWLLVQGDTTSAMAAAVSAFYLNIKIGHVEAGLRSFDMRSPFPEEFNRRVVALAADAHFAPTWEAKNNLLAEGVNSSKIVVTGNTVVDALEMTLGRNRDAQADIPFPAQTAMNAGKKIILATAHRRENHGRPLENICDAMAELAASRDDIFIIYPVHPNPAVRGTVYRRLAGVENIALIEPLSYLQLIALLRKSFLALTDSGGIQEEACALSIPALVLRGNTERKEGVDAGAAALVGSDKRKIMESAGAILDNPGLAASMARAGGKLYGDGKAAGRIARYLESANIIVES